MHRIKDLLLRYPACRSFHELPALYRSYATSANAGGPRDLGQGRRFGTRAAAEPFMNGSSSTYVEDMYEAWQRDPTSVHKVSYLVYFSHMCVCVCVLNLLFIDFVSSMKFYDRI